MSFWTDIRDAVESVASVAGNYFLPGSGLVTSQLTSKGSQEQLGSPLGMLAMLGTGVGGAATGQMSNYGTAFDAMTGGGTPATSTAGGAGAFDTAGFEGLSAVDAGVGANAATSPWWSSPQNALRSLGMTGVGSGTSGGGTGMASWISPLMNVGSGIYGMMQSEQMKKLAQQAIAGSSPWAASGGMGNAGAELTRTINGDISNDPGFLLAQQAAARASSQSPGGASTKAAADAALQYQNQRIQTLSAPAGVGFAPGTGFQTAVQGLAGGNALASSSLGSIGFGVNQATGGSPSMPPWLQQYLIQNGLRPGAA